MHSVENIINVHNLKIYLINSTRKIKRMGISRILFTDADYHVNLCTSKSQRR